MSVEYAGTGWIVAVSEKGSAEPTLSPVAFVPDTVSAEGSEAMARLLAETMRDTLASASDVELCIVRAGGQCACLCCYSHPALDAVRAAMKGEAKVDA